MQARLPECPSERVEISLVKKQGGVGGANFRMKVDFLYYYNSLLSSLCSLTHEFITPRAKIQQVCIDSTNLLFTSVLSTPHFHKLDLPHKQYEHLAK